MTGRWTKKGKTDLKADGCEGGEEVPKREEKDRDVALE